MPVAVPTNQPYELESVAELSARLKLNRQWRGPFLPFGRMRWLYILALIVSDSLMLGLGFWLAYHIRFASNLAFFQTDVVPSFSFYTSVVLVLVPLWLLIFSLLGLYQYERLLGGLQEYAGIFNATTVGLLVVILIAFFIEDFTVARGWLILAWLLNFLLVCSVRFILRRIVYGLRKKGYFLTPTLIVGSNGEAQLLGVQLSAMLTAGLNVLGFVSDDVPVGRRVSRNLYSLGSIEDLPELITRYRVKELIFASSAVSREIAVSIFQQYGFANQMNIRFSSGLFEIMTTGLQVKELAFTPLIRVNQLRLSGLERFLKTMLDYVLIGLASLLLVPLCVIIALLIKLDSPGPVVYRRRVLGIGGREFDAYKFRTMHINGDEILNKHPELKAELAKTHKLENDPRITRFGRILRPTSLDELPQFFNVILGQMSLVGPRMISPAELAEFGQWDMNLLTVKPGLTGLWQISGRSDLTYDDRVRLDMHYIRNYSIWFDIYIMWRTVPALLTGRGAY